MSKQDKLNNIVWGGSGIERALFEFILDKIPEGSKVLELGAGLCSTVAFATFYVPYSVDDNPNYIGLYKGVNYILAPRHNGGWYDRDIINAIPKDYAMIFVDGPSGHNREGILCNLDVLDTNVPIIFHDTNRLPEKALAVDVSEALGKKITFYNSKDHGDNWAVIE